MSSCQTHRRPGSHLVCLTNSACLSIHQCPCHFIRLALARSCIHFPVFLATASPLWQLFFSRRSIFFPLRFMLMQSVGVGLPALCVAVWMCRGLTQAERYLQEVHVARLLEIHNNLSDAVCVTRMICGRHYSDWQMWNSPKQLGNLGEMRVFVLRAVYEQHQCVLGRVCVRLCRSEYQGLIYIP